MKKILLSFFTIFGFAFYVTFFGKNGTIDYVATIPYSVEKSVGLQKITARTTIPVVSKPSPTPTTTKPPTNGQYTDGNYAGNSADAYYGYIKAEAVIQNGKLANVIFLDHPQDRGTSIRINNYTMPILKSEAIKAQSANVSVVSGATDSSLAFRQSLANALLLAKR